MLNLEEMSPRQIVEELDRYIIGQAKAKRAVAVALRNRVRRNLLSEDMRDEVAPKNIIMIGPTGVGKTEIARRLTKICGAPFIKVEATKFTEVGYVGRDVESMVRDLMANAVATVKSEMAESVKEEAEKRVEERLLALLIPAREHANDNVVDTGLTEAREKFREKLHAGELEDRKVELVASSSSTPQGLIGGIEIFPGAGGDDIDMDAINRQLGGLFGGAGKKKRSVGVKQAREILLAEEREKLVDADGAIEAAKERVENMGVIFIDEIDKIASKEGKTGSGPDISREGVQRDILPIVEGSVISTKFGPIDTGKILFIAAGAFNVSKPGDLIPELQGRFPIRVELEDMSADILEKILTRPKNALLKQYKALLKTEDVDLEFDATAVRRIAVVSAEMNANLENVGARRLHGVLEMVLEELSFGASEMKGRSITIDAAYVDEKMKNESAREDLKRYIL